MSRLNHFGFRKLTGPPSGRCPSGLGIGGVAAGWGAGLILVLQLHRFSIGAEHSICGPWGCGPPVPALLAYHGFWVVFLGLPTALCCRCLGPSRLTVVGGVAFLLGVLGIAGVAVREAVFWLPEVSEWQQPYFLQRWLFSVVTLVDVPMVQVAIAGAVCLVVAMIRRRRQRKE